MSRLLLFVFLSVIFLAREGWGQDSAGIAFLGTAGMYGELYSMKGIDTRRPHATGRVFLRGDLNVNGMQLPVDVFFSSEDDLLRQTINRYSIGYRNSWLDVRAGDIYPMYSPLLMNGAFLRGGHLSLTTEGMFLRINAGQNQRAINGNLSQGVIGTYRRFVYAGSAGYDDGAFSGAVQFLRGKDEISSITTPGFYTTPQENLIIGLLGGAAAFSQTLKLKAELNRSLWTRDIRELPQSNGRLPGVFGALFAERPSSVSDLAFRTNITYQLQGVSVSGLYQRIGSDYSSMGVFGFQPDWQEFRLQAMLPMMNYTLNFSAFGAVKKDNLNGKKFATTTRSNGGLNAGYRIDEIYTVNVNYSVYVDKNDAAQTSSQIDQISHNIMLQPMRDWDTPDHRQHADLMLGYQTMIDHVTRTFGSSGFTRYSLGGNYRRNFSPGISAYANYSFNSNKTGFGTMTSHAATIGASVTLVPSTASTSGQLTYGSESSSTNAFGNTRTLARLSGIYLFSETLQGQCDIEGAFYRATVAGGVSYTELRSSVTITKRF